MAASLGQKQVGRFGSSACVLAVLATTTLYVGIVLVSNASNEHHNGISVVAS